MAGRPMPKKPIKIGRAVLGGPIPLLCVPLVGGTEGEILEELDEISPSGPDLVELRVDAWKDIEDGDKSISLLRRVRSLLGDMPMILTCRGHWEGGVKEVSERAKDEIYGRAVSEELVDLVDRELVYGFRRLAEIKALCEPKGVRLIVSFHDFERTPSVPSIYSQLALQIRCGADVAKAAFMPRSEEDVLKVFEATLAVRRDFPDIPLVTMSMGSLGRVSRLAGGLYGSDMSFAAGVSESAPGQIPIGMMRGSFDLLYGRARLDLFCEEGGSVV